MSSGTAFKAKGAILWVQPDGNSTSGPANQDGGLYPLAGGFADQQNANQSTIISTLKSWGVNMVRYRLEAYTYNNISSAAQTAYIARIKSWHDALAAAGIVMMPCCWDGTDGGYTDLVTNATQLYPLLTAAYNACGDPLMPWEPVNEPHGMTSAQCLTIQEGLFLTLRNLGSKGHLIADWIDFANSGPGGEGFSDSDYSALEAYDATLLGGSHNTGFAKHDYANEYSSSVWSDSAWMAAIASTTSHVIWETEIGNQNGAPTTENATWNTNAVADLKSKQVAMPNFAGGFPFLFAWIDDNTMTQTHGNTTPTDNVTNTAWGTTARGFYA